MNRRIRIIGALRRCLGQNMDLMALFMEGPGQSSYAPVPWEPAMTYNRDLHLILRNKFRKQFQIFLGHSLTGSIFQNVTPAGDSLVLYQIRIADSLNDKFT